MPQSPFLESLRPYMAAPPPPPPPETLGSDEESEREPRPPRSAFLASLAQELQAPAVPAEDPRRAEARARLEAARAGGERQWQGIQEAPQEHPLAQLGSRVTETIPDAIRRTFSASERPQHPNHPVLDEYFVAYNERQEAGEIGPDHEPSMPDLLTWYERREEARGASPEEAKKRRARVQLELAEAGGDAQWGGILASQRNEARYSPEINRDVAEHAKGLVRTVDTTLGMGESAVEALAAFNRSRADRVAGNRDAEAMGEWAIPETRDWRRDYKLATGDDPEALGLTVSDPKVQEVLATVEARRTEIAAAERGGERQWEGIVSGTPPRERAGFATPETRREIAEVGQREQSERIEERARTTADLAERAADVHPRIPERVMERVERGEGYLPEDFWEGMKKDPIRTLTLNGVENLGPLMATMAATAIAGPAGGLTTGFSLEAGSAYQETKEHGADDAEAAKAAGITGVANMFLEYLPAGRAVNRLMKGAPRYEVTRLLRDMVEQAAAEGITESVQETNNLIVAAATYAEDHEWSFEDVKRVGAAGLIGLVTGGAAGVVTGAGAGRIEPGTEPPPAVQQTQPEEEASDGVRQEPAVQPARPDEVAPVDSVADQGRRPDPRRERDGEVEQRRQEVASAPTPRPVETPSLVQEGGGGVVPLPREPLDSAAKPAGPTAPTADSTTARQPPQGQKTPLLEGDRVRVGSREGVVAPGGEYRGTVRINFDDGRSEVHAASHAGQAGESVEAINRQQSGNRFYRIRPWGKAVPMLGVDAVDAPVARNEAKVLVGPDGNVTLVDGRLTAPMQKAVDDLRAAPPSVPVVSRETFAESLLPEQPQDFTAQSGYIGAKPGAAAAPFPVAFSRPEVEEGFKRGRMGAQEPGFVTKIAEAARTVGEASRRELRHVPGGAKFARFRESIRRIRTYDPSGEVARQLQEVVRPLKDQQYDLFLRKALLDDLAVIAEQYEADTQLPFGITKEDLVSDKPKIDEAATADPYVSRAVEQAREVWTKAREDYRAAANALGMDASFLDRRGEAYLHHQVIEYALADRSRLRARQVKTPKGRGFQRELKGSVQDISLNYGEAQGQVLTQLALDAEMARQLKRIKDNDDISDKLKKQAKAQSTPEKKVDWETLLPEGYSLWQPDEGSIFYLGQTVTDRIAKRLLVEGTVEITPEDLRKAVVMGGQRAKWALPNEIVATLKEIADQRTSEVARVNQSVVRGWKKLMLLMPRRVFKYVLRNLVGDVQKTVMGNPAALKKLKQAASELASYVYGREAPTPALRQWMAHGGWKAGLFQQELEETEAGRRTRLRTATEIGGEIEKAKNLRKLPARYFGWAGRHVSFLEALNRYANFLAYREQMAANPDGRPKNYGASRADEIMALETIDDRAYWLSNQLIGAYDQVTEAGQHLRRHLIPFWSFQELNVRSHWGLLRNAVTSPESAMRRARKIGGLTLLKSPMAAYRVGKLAGLVTVFEAAMHAWNYGFFEDEEDDLPLEIRRTPHIILGRNDDGTVRYFNRLSVFYELREWFGADEFYHSLPDYLDGRISAKQLFAEVAAVPGSKLLNSIGPVSGGGVKTLMELALRKTTFPQPRDIHDRWDYVYRTVGMEEEFREATGRPTPSGGYLSSWRNAFLYAAEPGASAYYDTLSNIRRFKRSIGDDSEGSFSGTRTEALRNFKRAIRYGQPELGEKYLRIYVAAGGTSKGFARSLQRMDPLSGLKKDLRPRLMEWLTPDELAKLKDAEAYYEEVFGLDSPGTEEGREFVKALEAGEDPEWTLGKEDAP